MAMDQPSEAASQLIEEFRRKYIWWEPEGDRPFSTERIIAQAINYATYDDVRRLEAALGRARLAQVMLNAAPGWLNDRSWSFWRGRLARAAAEPIPERAPRRAVNAVAT